MGFLCIIEKKKGEVDVQTVSMANGVERETVLPEMNHRRREGKSKKKENQERS